MRQAFAIAGLLSTMLAAPGLVRGAEEPPRFFREHVAPLFVGHCLECHGEQRAGGLDLRSHATLRQGGASGAVVKPGAAAQSLLIHKVVSGEMPPKGALSDEQTAVLKQWVDEGAFFPDEPLDAFAFSTETRAGYDWWSLQPLVAPHPLPPASTLAGGKQHPIDRFIHGKLKENGLEPSPPAAPRTLVRRVTYDLIGLPPTPREVEDFIAACHQETGQAGAVGDRAYSKLVDRLLASSHYGERWGRHWLDVVRFGESNGFERNVLYTNAWPFRDYVIKSFNDDKPFDRFIQEQLAGDVIGPDDPEVLVGTTFLVCGPYDNVGNQNAEAAAQIRADAIDEMIRVTTEAFTGLTVGCARCHDHKFDPISQRDYYALYATFAGVRHGDRPVPVAAQEGAGEVRWWVGTFEQVDGPFHVFGGGSPQQPGVSVTPASLKTLESVHPGYHLPSNAPEGLRRLRLAEWIASRENPLTARVLANRLWHYHFGTGIVNTPSDFGFLGDRPSHPALLDWLALRLDHHGWRLKPLHKEMLLSDTYRQASDFRPEAARVDADTRLLWRFPPQRLAGEQIRDATLAIAGCLDHRMGGPGFRLFHYVEDNVATYHPLDKPGPDTYRRSVYHHNARATQIDLLSEFDTPDCAFAAPRRSTTTSPLQSLTLLNHQFTLDMAAAMAQRLEREAEPSTRDRQITLAFELAFSRGPDEEEIAAARELVDRYGLAAFCHALLGASEFIHVD